MSVLVVLLTILAAQLQGHYKDEEHLRVIASPGLMTLLDDALYRAYEAELSPTVLVASRLLSDLIEMKEASALVLRECRWATGVPLGGGDDVARDRRWRE